MPIEDKHMKVSAEIEAAIAAAVKENFTSASVVGLNIRAGEDHDGDKVLRIHVIFDDGRGKGWPDPRETVSLTGHIRSNLAKLDFHDFPLVSFVSKRDFPKLKLEAA